MDDDDYVLVDLCSEYISSKKASYIAKEGMIVYFASITGRDRDYLWHKHSMTETLRIIRATKLNSKLSRKLSEHHLITAFQELGRVYEYSTKSRRPTAGGIFNYFEHSEMSLKDEAISMFVDEMKAKGLVAVLLTPLKGAISELNRKLRLKATNSEIRDLMTKHFETAGYDIKKGSTRPRVNGKKLSVVMKSRCLPEDIKVEVDYTEIIEKIYRELI